MTNFTDLEWQWSAAGFLDMIALAPTTATN